MSSAVTTTQITYWMMCPMKSERTMVSLSTPILISGIDNLCTLNHLTRGLFSQLQYSVFVLLSACYLFLAEALWLKEVKKIQITEKGKLIYTKVRRALLKKKDEIGEPAERIAQMDFKLKENCSWQAVRDFAVLVFLVLYLSMCPPQLDDSWLTVLWEEVEEQVASSLMDLASLINQGLQMHEKMACGILYLNRG